MRSRFLPYATTPGRLLVQVVSDLLVALWIVLWVGVGLGVHSAIATISSVGRQVNDSATGLSDNLHSAGDSVHGVPLIGDTMSKPLRAASEAALDLAGAGHQLDSTAAWLAVLLAIAVAAPPILAVGMPWLFLRIRFFRRKWTVIALTRTPAGEQLLALRALANRPLRKLTEISTDPVGAWRHDDPMAIRGLAALELRSAGVAPPRYWRGPQA
ncbi:hypothetical protein MANY_31520 [Mycolicibacterium anyangense]|uniref:Transmembrane protein n=1 Tax=Mycolicibacterium anyangense TaxID=1431246 RepID=A0A6N4WAP2_9MYCO|nr:hypothetical protein [Mycolicibacterium anyangense]BBZ77815.1 hypothetical protein MANY_31520 [Mycolicibacterium anyangense]